MDICKLFRKFGGDTSNYQEIQRKYVAQKAHQAWPIVQAVEKSRAMQPKLKSATAPSGNPVKLPKTPALTGDFQSKNHPEGINLRALAATDSPFTRDEPLSQVFSRLMKQPVKAIPPANNLRSWLGL